MIGKFLLLASIALVYGRPSDVPKEFTRPKTLWEPSDQCPDKHWLLSHEWDCTKFYYCEYGMKYIEPTTCAPGTQFSYDLQVCIHPQFANCQLPNVPPTEPEVVITTTEVPTEPPTTTQAPTQPPTTTQTPTEPPTTTQAPTEPPTTTQTPTQPPTTTQAPTQPPTTTQSPTEPPTTTQTPTQPPTTTQALTQPPTTTQTPTEPPTTTQAPTQPPTTTLTPTEPTTTTQAPTQPPTTTEAPGTDAPETDNEDENATGGLDNGGFLENGCPADFDVHWLVPHANDCSKFYYCVRGELVERECGSNTHFNPVLQVCDWPENAGCIASTGTPGTGGQSTEDPGTGGQPTDAPGTNEFLPNGCPADFDVHWLLPHDTNCSKFYYCVRGELVERECDSNTHFNPILQVCDWPENAGCVASTGAPGTSGQTTEAPGTGGQLTEEPGTGEQPTDAPGTNEFLPNGCPADFDVHWLLPHDTNCSKFYYCVRGELVERECDSNTHFNPILQVCDWPENAGCIASTGAPGTGGQSTENPETGGQSTEDPGTGGQSTEDPGTGGQPTDAPGTNEFLPNGCPADFDVHWLLPHDTNCSKFYYCIRGELVERECGSNTHFNPVLQVCDWPENAGCIATTEAPGTGGQSTEDPGTGGQSTEAPGTGGQTPTESSTTTEALGTDAPETDNEDENATGELDNGGFLENGCPADFDVHWLVPHETDCSKFYYCVRGELVERECGSNTHFNPVLQVCDWPENAGCIASTGAPETGGPSTENPGFGGQTTEAPGTGGQTTENPGTGGQSTEAPGTGGQTTEAPGTGGQSTEDPGTGGQSTEDPGTGGQETDKCKDNCHVLPWAHATDCDKFWRCEGKSAVLNTCSEGLHFNPATATCDFICNANCVREEIQASSGSDGIKIFLPWDKVDNYMLKLIELNAHEDIHH